MITNAASGTRIEEVADGIYRINTPLDVVPGGFSFNQYLVVDDEPTLFHTGYRKMFPLVSEAISKVIPASSLRHIGYSHFEGDECGAMNEFLSVAPNATPFASEISVLTSLNDFCSREGRALKNGEVFSTGKRRLRWLYTPHVPHGWDCGVLFDESTEALLCGDLFTQGGSNTPAVTESDVLGPSELFRKPLDYFAHSVATDGILENLAELNPKLLACMHGSAYRGDGAALLRALNDTLARERVAALAA